MLKKITKLILINGKSKKKLPLDNDQASVFLSQKNLLINLSCEIYKIQSLINDNVMKSEICEEINHFEKRFNHELNILKECYQSINKHPDNLIKTKEHFEKSLEVIEDFIQAVKWKTGNDIKSFLLLNQELFLKRKSGLITQLEYEKALDEKDIVDNPLGKDQSISCLVNQFNELKDNFIDTANKIYKLNSQNQSVVLK